MKQPVNPCHLLQKGQIALNKLQTASELINVSVTGIRIVLAGVRIPIQRPSILILKGIVDLLHAVGWRIACIERAPCEAVALRVTREQTIVRVTEVDVGLHVCTQLTRVVARAHLPHEAIADHA